MRGRRAREGRQRQLHMGPVQGVRLMATKRTMKKNPWLTMRANHLALYPECRICEDVEDVVVHHLRYRGKKGVDEQPGDLVTLCRFHHDGFHRIYGTAGRHRGSLVRNTLEYIKVARAEVEAIEAEMRDLETS
jgi:5-methylcytosine-specific restriction endonuclease McrA